MGKASTNPVAAKSSAAEDSDKVIALAPARANHAVQSEKVGLALWLQRLSMLIFVMFCLELGVLLIGLPWTQAWTDNTLLVGHPNLRLFISYGAVRGAVSGLGLVDIGIGIWQAVIYLKK